jgi:hypothetical protein
MFDWLLEKKGVNITMVTSGQFALYNAYLPGDKHKDRLDKKPEAIYEEIAEQALPASKYYLVLEVGGEIKESGGDF